MELKQIQDPHRRGVKLTPTDSEIVTTESGWRVQNFQGDDGHEYERATKSGQGSRWFRLVEFT